MYEAADTFLFTPGHRTKTGPHVRDGIDLKRMMIMVVIALIPCTLFGMWNVGFQHERATTDWALSPADANHLQCLIYGAFKFIPIYAVTIIVGGTLEAIFSLIRKHEINEGFLVTSLLFPLTLPPDIPLWQVALGIAFGVVVGKEIFGGTGMNILNPALTARIFLYRYARTSPATRSGSARRGRHRGRLDRRRPAPPAGLLRAQRRGHRRWPRRAR